MSTYNQKSGSITGTWDANSALNLTNSDLGGTFTTGVTYTFAEDQEVEWVKAAANTNRISLVLYNAAGTKLLQHDFTSAEVTTDKNTTPKVNLGTVNGVRKVVLNNLTFGLISVYSLDLFKGPPVPTGLNAIAGDTQVVLNWNSIPGVLGYSVYRNNVKINTSLLTTNTFSDTGLTNNAAYEYQVTSTTPEGESGKSLKVTATPKPPQRPEPPTEFTATAGDKLAILNWSAVINATGYNVYQNGIKINGSLLTATSYTDTGLINNTKYEYKITAVNIYVESAPSATVEVTPRALPAVPTGVTATAGNQLINLKWNDSSGATSYKIYQNGSLLTSITSTAYVATGLTNGTSYSYQVVAVNAAGESEKSLIVTATPTLPPPPVTPAGLSAIAGNEKVTLSWLANTTNSDVKQYNIYKNGVYLNSVNHPTTSFIVTGLTNGTEYSFTINAENNTGGVSAGSAAVKATPTLPPPPVTPAGLSAIAGNGKVTLSWLANTANSDVKQYNIYKNGVYLNSVSHPTTSFIVVGLTNGTEYSFTINAENDTGGISAGSAAVKATPFLDTTPPAVPTGLVAKPGDKQIQLTWTKNTTDSDIFRYHIYKNGLYLNTVNHPISSFLATGLTNGMEYSFIVHAEDKSGNVSAGSAAAKATPFAPIVRPILTAKSGNQKVEITWTAVPGATEYRVYRNGVPITNTGSLSYIDEGVQNGTVYTYEVAAVVGGAEGVHSQPVAARPGDFIDFEPGGERPGGSVIDFIQTGWDFAKKYWIYTCLLLGLILAPVLISFLTWLSASAKVSPKKVKNTNTKRQPLTAEEKEKRARERRLNKVRDEKYQTLTRMNRTAERDTWVKSTGYLRPEERQQKAREQRNAIAREQRAAARDGKSKGSGRSQRSGRTSRNARKGR